VERACAARAAPPSFDLMVLLSGHFPRALSAATTATVAFAGAAFLAAACLPFVRPAARFLARR